MSIADGLIRLSVEAPGFIKAFHDRQSTAVAQSKRLNDDATLDEVDKTILRRWLEVSEQWLRDNTEKYHRCCKIQTMDIEQIKKLADEISAIQITLGH